MSRFGKIPVSVPAGVEVHLEDLHVTVKGPLGQLEHRLPDILEIQYDEPGRQLRINRKADDKRARRLHGLSRSLVANMVEGVSTGFAKAMELHGVGYNVQAKGKELVMQVGFCHPVNKPIPVGVEVEVQQAAAQPDRPAQFTVKGYDKQLVGQFAADVRAVRPPEPYKGKGIRYADEHVRRKVGKALAGLEA